MREFTDLANRTWQMRINVHTLDLLRENGPKVDLLEIIVDDGKLMEKLALNPAAMCNCVYWLVKEQCDKAKVDARSFAEAWDGDIADKAIPAFWEEVFNFFPKRQRIALAKIWQKQEELGDKALEFVLKKVDSDAVNKIAQKEMKKIDKELDKRARESDETSGPSPEVSE